MKAHEVLKHLAFVCLAILAVQCEEAIGDDVNKGDAENGTAVYDEAEMSRLQSLRRIFVNISETAQGRLRMYESSKDDRPVDREIFWRQIHKFFADAESCLPDIKSKVTEIPDGSLDDNVLDDYNATALLHSAAEEVLKIVTRRMETSEAVEDQQHQFWTTMGRHLAQIRKLLPRDIAYTSGPPSTDSSLKTTHIDDTSKESSTKSPRSAKAVPLRKKEDPNNEAVNEQNKWSMYIGFPVMGVLLISIVGIIVFIFWNLRSKKYEPIEEGKNVVESSEAHSEEPYSEKVEKSARGDTQLQSALESPSRLESGKSVTFSRPKASLTISTQRQHSDLHSDYCEAPEIKKIFDSPEPDNMPAGTPNSRDVVKYVEVNETSVKTQPSTPQSTTSRQSIKSSAVESVATGHLMKGQSTSSAIQESKPKTKKSSKMSPKAGSSTNASKATSTVAKSKR